MSYVDVARRGGLKSFLLYMLSVFLLGYYMLPPPPPPPLLMLVLVKCAHHKNTHTLSIEVCRDVLTLTRKEEKKKWLIAKDGVTSSTRPIALATLLLLSLVAYLFLARRVVNWYTRHYLTVVAAAAATAYCQHRTKITTALLNTSLASCL